MVLHSYVHTNFGSPGRLLFVSIHIRTQSAHDCASFIECLRFDVVQMKFRHPKYVFLYICNAASSSKYQQC